MIPSRTRISPNKKSLERMRVGHLGWQCGRAEPRALLSFAVRRLHPL